MILALKSCHTKTHDQAKHFDDFENLFSLACRIQISDISSSVRVSSPHDGYLHFCPYPNDNLVASECSWITNDRKKPDDYLRVDLDYFVIVKANNGLAEIETKLERVRTSHQGSCPKANRWNVGHKTKHKRWTKKTRARAMKCRKLVCLVQKER